MEQVFKNDPDKPLSFYKKINALMDKIGGYIQKDGTNVQQKYKYVSEGAVLSKVQPALVKCSLLSIPEFELLKCKDKATAKGAIWQLATVKCTITLMDADSPAHKLVFTGLGQGTDPGDKAIAKAQTQAFKYAWWKFLCLETGDDPEADPKTDEQQFSVPGSSQVQNAVATVPAPGPLVVDPRSPIPMQVLVDIWNYVGLNIKDLEPYILQRFGKPQIVQISPAEFSTLINEFVSYYSQQGYKIELLPF